MADPGPGEAIELGVTYISVVGETSKLADSIKAAVRDGQRYATTHPIKLKADVDVSHIGAIEIPATADTTRFDTGIRDAITLAQVYAARHAIDVKATVDLDLQITAQQRAALQSIRNLTDKNVKVKVVLDMSQAELERLKQIAPALRSIRNLSDKTIRVKVVLDMSQAELERLKQIAPALRGIRNLSDKNVRIQIRLDMTDAELERLKAVAPALRGLSRLTSKDVTIRIAIQADEVRLARIAELLRDIRSRNVSVNVRSDANNVAEHFLRLNGSLSKISGIAAAAGAGIAVIGGAAGAAVGAVGILAAGIAALGPAALAAGATVAVGLQGVGDAFKALSAASESAGQDAQSQAKAVAAAEDQLISAYEQRESAVQGVKDAQRSLTDAEKDARDAVSDVARAYKDAADELEDYQLKLKDASLSEQEAALALREARDEFAKAPPQEREKAFLRLQRAELRYTEAQERNRDVQAEAADAQAKGIEGSDKVVAAKDRVAKADERVAEAQRGIERANQQVEKANRQVQQAQDALTDATTKTSAAQDKAAQALAKLSPNAREFVLAAREAKPAWEDFTRAVQDRLFDGAAAGISALVTNSLPTLKAGMIDVAGSLNGLTQQFVAFWQAPQNLAGIQSIFAGTKSFIDGLGPGLQQATTGFLSLGQAFEPVANKVGAQFAGMLGQIGQAFTDTFQNGQLTQLISTFGDVLQGLGAGLNPLIKGLIEMGNIVGPTLGPFFEQFGKSIQALAPSMGQLGATFINVLTAILPDLDKFIAALATGLEPVLPVIGDLLKSLMAGLTPMIGPLSQITQIVGTALAQAITALAPSIGPLSDAFASLINAIAPMLPVVAEVVAGIVTALAPALKTIFDALGPVIKQWADAMLPVFRELQPVLADVAQKIGTAVAGALQQIAPYIPDIARSFGDLVLAIAPLLPQLVQIAADLLPPFLNLVIAILPQILQLVDLFTRLATVAGPIVVSMLRDMTQGFKDGFSAAATAVTTARDVFGAAFNTIGGWLEDLKNTFSRSWDGIVHAFAVSIKAIGELLEKVPNIHIPGTNIDLGQGVSVMGTTMIQWAKAHGAWRGGPIVGPGSATSDSIPVMLSNGEFVVNAAATARSLPLLSAINAGWVPPPELLHMMLPGFRDGGMVPGKKFAESMDPVPYLMGGFSRTSIDCSGMVAAVVNDALGLDPFSGRMSTINEGSWLAAKGAKPGLGGPGDISIGWFDRGGGANGHTAMTLGDGTNVESRGGDGVVVGSRAAGARDPMFDKHMHIPAALLRGGDLGGPATSGGVSGGRPSKLGGGTGAPGATNGGGLGANSSAPGATGSPGADAGTATPVFVTNWPAGFNPTTTTPSIASSPTGSNSFGDQLDAGRPSPLAGTPEEALRAAGVLGPSPSTSSTPTPSTPSSPLPLSPTPSMPGAGGAQGSHPLANLPVPGAKELFNGPAPWYLAASPEQAVANLGTQAASLAARTGSDFVSFFQNNWKEMLGTGLAVAGMGIGGGGAAMPPMQVNNYGMDPHSAAQAVDRVVRRRTLANQRGGGFGR